MPDIVRFSVSLESDLLEQFDRFCLESRFATRSEAIRQLLRERLTAVAVAGDTVEVAASLTVVYDHHKARLTDKMIEIQHDHADLVVSTMHVHLNHDLCMELIALRGPAAEIQALARELSGLKGIHHAKIFLVTAEEGMAGHGGHGHSH